MVNNRSITISIFWANSTADKLMMSLFVKISKCHLLPRMNLLPSMLTVKRKKKRKYSAEVPVVYGYEKVEYLKCLTIPDLTFYKSI